MSVPASSAMFSEQPTAYNQVLSLVLSSAALFLLRISINTDFASLLFLSFAGAGIAVLGLAGLNNPRLAGDEQKLAGTMAALFTAGITASAYLISDFYNGEALAYAAGLGLLTMTLAAWGALTVGELLNARRRIRSALIACFLIAVALLIGPQLVVFPSMEMVAPAIILGGALGSAVLYTKVSPVPSRSSSV